MGTMILYYSEPYTREFTAEIVSSGKKDGRWDVVLDRTCFYPGGGGQREDLGRIGGAEVTGMYKDGDTVHHLLESSPSGKDGIVECSIDWDTRYDYMQQHTGQHIISGVLHKFGYGTVYVHMGERYTSIETDVPFIPEDDLDRIEETVNLTIAGNLRVLDFSAGDDEIPALNLRRPPKVKGKIRIVEIEGYDRVACGGVHTASTGEVLFAKIVSTEKIRGHVRISWLLGNRVLNDYRNKMKLVRDLSGILSAPEEEILPSVSRLAEENSSLKKELDSFKLEDARREAEGILSSAEDINGILFAVKEFNGRDPGFLKRLTAAFPGDREYAVCLVNRSGGRLLWALAVTAEDFDFNRVREDLMLPIAGKGGGRKPFFQGAGTGPDGTARFFEVFREIIHGL